MASSLLWPKYAAFYLPGLPLINPQRIANALILLILASVLATHRVVQDEVKESFENNKPFWIMLVVFIIFRILSVGAASDKAPSIYRYIQEFFTHVVFVLLGLHFGSNEERLKKFTKTIFISFILISILAIIERVIKKNIFSYFIVPQNEYMAWALNDNTREGSYRAKSTFDHPLTFAEFITIGTSLSWVFALKITSRAISRFAAAST